MSILGKALKYGLLNKAINEARKPKNQQKAKELFQSFMDKRKGSPGAASR